MRTILDMADPTAAAAEPFPHIIVENALPQDYYDALASSFPKLEDIPPEKAAGNNARLDLLSSWGEAMLPQERIPPAWKSFMNDHTSADFSKKIFDLFPQIMMCISSAGHRHLNIERYGPDLADKLGLQAPVADVDIVGRVTLAANTPVSLRTSVRGPHVDSPRKAYVGLYYLADPNDDTHGGDLALFRWKDSAPQQPWAQKIDPDLVEQVALIPYQPNTLVLMMCTHDSIHGVTPRDPTSYMRRFAVISGWFPTVDKANFARGALAQ